MSGPPWVKWSEGEKSLFVHLFNEGLSLRLIAEQLGRPYGPTRKMRATLGLPPRASGAQPTSIVGGMHSLNIRLTERLFFDMKRKAGELHLTQASFIRQALREKIERHNKALAFREAAE